MVAGHWSLVIIEFEFFIYPDCISCLLLIHQIHIPLLFEDKPGHVWLWFHCSIVTGGVCLVFVDGAGRNGKPSCLPGHFPGFFSCCRPANFHWRRRCQGTDIPLRFAAFQRRYEYCCRDQFPVLPDNSFC